jgi:Ca-activated chloride channel family protein
MRGRLLIIVLALAAVAVAFAASGEETAEKPRSGSAQSGGAKPAAGSVRVTLVYSLEKEKLLAPLIEHFNAERQESDGRPVFVDAKVVASGEVETRIAKGTLRPTMWSPASSFWGRLLNYEADGKLVADDPPSIVRTPLVIAMWEELADAYGYPERKLGYKELRELATGGWAAAGKPQFGPFKYVHTNPDFSTSGLSAVAASYYAAAGKKEGLTEADVDKSRSKVRRLERSIVHYGDTTLFISQEMRKHGLGYASAAAMEEITLIDFNREAGDGERLVAVYPEEGTFYSDNPLYTLEGEWVSAEQKRAAQLFADFLAKEVTPEVAGREGFRPADESKAPAGLVSPASGVDPEQPARALTLPEPRVLAKIRSAWRSDRKPANVMMVFDNSLSMGDENKIQQAKDGLEAFFREAAPQDRIGLTRFSSDVVPLVPIAPMRTNRAKLAAAVKAIFPDGDTRVRDATVDAVEAVEAKFDPGAINAVVLLTDGVDTVSSRSADAVVKELEAQGRKESGQIRVFTIAYGSEPNESELARYAEATGGKAYEGTKDDIESVYLSISSFF